MKAWINHTITDASEAKISVLDHGLLYGDGVFEGIRISHRRIFRLSDHLARLGVSATAIGLSLPWDDTFLTSVVVETARAHGKDEAYVRLVVTRGVGALGVDPSSCREPSLVCIVGDIALYSESQRREGISLMTSSLRRPPFDVLDPRVKSLNYLNNVLAKAEARRAGADEALVLNQAGRIAEASVANVFVVSEGALMTPPPNEGALAGITRQSLLECARDQGLDVREQPVSKVDLYSADEVFLTGSGAGALPVASLDGQRCGRDHRRPVFALCSKLLEQTRETEGAPF